MARSVWSDAEMLCALDLRGCGRKFQEIADYLTLQRGAGGEPISRNAVAGTLHRIDRDSAAAEGAT
ncbi:hypothetical protein OE699_01900 [Sedimentimonas flavescens]|uniref:Uncharacterized protein n=1 Tax=Sedimentimonas flavescens TaxID=2851012 RepID=A0ABT2ZVG4_9RHOB|nr:hypothetical protein [Sedimentimonas flavescens]MCV2877592.1 hypothetical protein [Sedimentimonas flavescens]